MGIFVKQSMVDLCSPVLESVKEQLMETSFAVRIDSIVFSGALTRMRNWASPGSDGIQG